MENTCKTCRFFCNGCVKFSTPIYVKEDSKACNDYAAAAQPMTESSVQKIQLND